MQYVLLNSVAELLYHISSRTVEKLKTINGKFKLSK